ncbi:MAG: glycosyltransferase [Caldilineaceae bacterium]|nr:glycosyltransferase [Caldilineaceae bacterium]
MIPIKGVHLLLQAVSRLYAEERAPFRVKLYGDPNKSPAYGGELAELAADLPNVEFCGTYPRDASARIFDGLDVLVVPSLWYDFPLVIHEAFATKTPVIASRLGGMAESVQDGVNGLLFTPGDVDDLARQLARLVADRTLWRRLRANIGPVKSVATEVRELVSMYEELLSPRAALSPPAYCNYAKKGI